MARGSPGAGRRLSDPHRLRRQGPAPPRVLLLWSSGKDSAWTLHELRRQGADVAALLTSFDEPTGRVATHAVPGELVEAQAAAAGLPLWRALLRSPCTNEEYERRLRPAWARARDEGITHVAFGDLFLEEIRDYRVRQLAGTGLEPLFPLWTTPAGTAALARTMLAAGLGAVVTRVDPARLDASLEGRAWDEAFLAELPAGVDPCGENGEFHTFCHRGPMFRREIAVAPAGLS